MQLLLVERFDQFLQLAAPSPRAVSVDLRAPVPHHSFSLIPESAFSSMVNDLDPPLIVDSGASCCISPHRDDFESYSPSSAKIKDLSGTNSVAGEGMIRWCVFHSSGRDFTISIRGYHIPTASVRLLSPQALYKSVGGHGEQDITKYSLVLPDGARQPPCFTDVFSECSLLLFLVSMRFFHTSDRDVWARNILAASNQNLTLAQKELLLWHQRLSHAALATVQNISRQRRDSCPSTSSDLVRLPDSPLLPCTYNVPTTACDNLLCAACEISKATRRLAAVCASHSTPHSHMRLKEGHVQPGDCVSCDHFTSPVPGWIISSSGHSSSTNGYTCSTIYVDHCSTFICINHQLTTSASDTIRGKLLLELEAADVGVSIKGYHTDNGVFSSSEFRSHCSGLGQSLRFSGVGAHHQNGVAERVIQTITNMARANSFMRHSTGLIGPSLIFGL
eukprot:CCRYP_014091-RB/>CCRYP_014091-RB protein AED:0.37 eAED:0.31 QI:0/0/0/1/1/1/2/0/446